GLFPILALMTISSFVLRPVVELLPSIADVIYGSGAGTLALFSSCMGLGAAVSGAWMASNAKPSPFNTILVASIAMSLCTGRLLSVYGLLLDGAPAVRPRTTGLSCELVGLQAPGILASILTLAATLLTSRRRVPITRGLL